MEKIVLFLLVILFGIVIFPRVIVRLTSIILVPLVKIWTKIRIKNGKEDAARFREREGIHSKPRPEGDLVWIHAVSIGESLSVIPLIEILKQIDPSVSILLTTNTVTSRDVIEKRLGDTVIHQFSPFDVFPWVRRFLWYWKPKMVFFIESELWPNMLLSLKNRKIPVYLLNTRLSPKSFKRWNFIKRCLNVKILDVFEEVFTPSKRVSNYASALGAKKTVVLPNLKIIASQIPYNEEDALILQKKIENRPTWIAVSTHEGEEEIIVSSHKKIRQDLPNILTFIAIRHPQRLQEVIELCEENNLTFEVHSDSFKTDSGIKSDIYIIDAIGVLGMFFKNIKTAFVGGSLVPLGGHNVLEPLSFGCDVFTGPYISNIIDIYTYLRNAWHKIDSADELSGEIKKSIELFERKDLPVITQYQKDWFNHIKRLYEKS